MVSLTNGSALARTVGRVCSLFFFFSLLYSFFINYRLSKTRFGPCKVIYRFFKAVVYFFFCSLLYFFLFNLRLSKTRFGPCKVIYGFLRQWCIFFFCSMLYSFLFNHRLSKTRFGPCKVINFMDFLRQWCIFFFHCSTLSSSTTDRLKHFLRFFRYVIIAQRFFRSSFVNHRRSKTLFGGIWGRL